MLHLNLRKAATAAVAFGLGTTFAMGSVLPVSASATEVEFRKIDTSVSPQVKFSIMRPSTGVDTDPIKITEDGKPVTNFQVQSLAEAQEGVGVILMVDTSESTKERGIIEAQKEAAKKFVLAKAPNEKYGIVGYNGTARPIVNLTNDTQALLQGIENMRPTLDPAISDGVALAANLLQSEPTLQANVIVLSAAKDTSSTSKANEAAAELSEAKAAFFAVGVTTRNVNIDKGVLGGLAERTGGQYYETDDVTKISEQLTSIQRTLQTQSLVSYSSAASNKSVTLSVQIGQFIGGAEASPGTISLGTDIAPPAPAIVEPGFFSGERLAIMIGIVILLAVALLGYGVLEIVGSEKNQLSRALRPYLDGPQEDEGPRDFSKLADSDIIKKAIASTAKAAQDRGLLQYVQARLEQADLPLRPAEALFFTGLAAGVGMLLGLVVFGPFGLLLAGMMFLYLPIAITGIIAKRRKKKFTGQLPDMLQLLAGSMRAGYSLVQGLDAVSKQAEAPMGTELQRAMNEARLGRPIDEALQDVSDRMQSADFEWAVMAIKIQRDVGGNLAELLMTVGETMIARERLRREVAGLTAEGRMSAIILVGLPPAVGAMVMVVNPSYMDPLIKTGLGQLALLGAACLMAIGWVVMQKLMKVEA